MNRICFVIFVQVYCILNIHGRSIHFEVTAEGFTKCPNPHPPLAKNPTIVMTLDVRRHKKKTYITGQYLVMEDTPFLNFSVSTYGLENSGKQDLKAVFENLSCHSWISKAYLNLGKFRYSKKDCIIRKGTYGFNDVDIDAILHRVPNYHEKGKIMHKVTLVHNGSTVFCNEIKLSIVDI